MPIVHPDRLSGGLTDWSRLDTMTEEEIERLAADDPDNPATSEVDWANAYVIPPGGRDDLIRLDSDLLAHFQALGPDWRARVNTALRLYLASATKAAE